MLESAIRISIDLMKSNRIYLASETTQTEYFNENQLQSHFNENRVFLPRITTINQNTFHRKKSFFCNAQMIENDECHSTRKLRILIHARQFQPLKSNLFEPIHQTFASMLCLLAYMSARREGSVIIGAHRNVRAA